MQTGRGPQPGGRRPEGDCRTSCCGPCATPTPNMGRRADERPARSPIPWIAEHAKGDLVEAWHAGSQAGHAIADVLVGDYNPSGKLAGVVPAPRGAAAAHLQPQNTGRPTGTPESVFWSHYTDAPNTPLFPFGFGLSYTTFAYSNLRVRPGRDRRERAAAGECYREEHGAARRRRGGAALRARPRRQPYAPGARAEGFEKIEPAARPGRAT